MSIEPPRPGEPRRPLGPRDPGDAWVVSDTGERYWGRFGAAGLLALDPDAGVLLQHRVAWSHHGDTWGIPGGARHQGESAEDAAVREATEEAGVPPRAVRCRVMRVLDLGIWTYSTVIADVLTPFDPVISDPESNALAWVPAGEVEQYPLHPGFAASWPDLADLLDVRPAVVVDVANVVGSVPNGWWKDRAGAAATLIARLDAWAGTGVPGGALDLADGVWFPEVSAVVEGAARGASGTSRVEAVSAPRAGDDEIVAEAERRAAAGCVTTVVTSDRGLASRAEEVGARVRPVSWLRDQLPE